MAWPLFEKNVTLTAQSKLEFFIEVQLVGRPRTVLKGIS